MEWLKRSIDKRLDPELVLSESCSVVVLGVNYLPPEGEVRSQRRWAKYSLYLDYHDTIVKALRAAGRLLEERFGLEGGDYRYYVDTGPVMERGWAAASGLGWQGKNGMLLSRKHGNWLLLATILTRLPIEADPPLKAGSQSREAGQTPELGLYCGKCVRCMEACPTDAIVEPGLLDAYRCISYQTIENKGVIRRRYRAAIGTRIFGCDICLDVCPWNRFAQEGRRHLLESRYRVADLGLAEILRMDLETFREVFRKTPMKRLKLRGLLRNACIAAGNLDEHPDWRPGGGALGEEYREEVARALLPLARHEEAVVRPHAVWALYRLLGDKARERLAAARAEEEDAETLEEYRYWEGGGGRAG